MADKVTSSAGSGQEDSTIPRSTSMGSGGTKRTSQHGGNMFGNLSNLKRDSQDANTQARKASLSEQNAQPTVVGQIWDKFTKGSGTGDSK